jgi:hypothetical protein
MNTRDCRYYFRNIIKGNVSPHYYDLKVGGVAVGRNRIRKMAVEILNQSYIYFALIIFIHLCCKHKLS